MSIQKQLIHNQNIKRKITMYTYNQEIKNRNSALLDHALDAHSRILMVRFDVRYPKDIQAPADNTLLVKFIKDYSRYLRRQGYDPVYLWCREQNESHNHHYHVCFLLDGTKVRYMPTLKKATEIWNRKLDRPIDTKGVIHYCNPNGTIINRNDDEAQEDALNTLSYLAKEHSKQNINGIRNWGSSSLC